MSKILIVSKTRMKDARVCVGGVDLDQHLSVRLLNVNGIMKKKRSVRTKWEIYGIAYMCVTLVDLHLIWKIQMFLLGCLSKRHLVKHQPHFLINWISMEYVFSVVL